MGRLKTFARGFYDAGDGSRSAAFDGGDSSFGVHTCTCGGKGSSSFVLEIMRDSF